MSRWHPPTLGGVPVPGDPEIRALLKARLIDDYRDDPDTLVVEEFGLCRGHVRVDIAVVNGFLHGYEIKSDRDSLRRLHRQAEVYSQVFDRVTLVVGSKHVEEARRLVPTWWGIRTVHRTQTGFVVRQRRRDRQNASRNARSLVELLWLDECLHLLKKRNALRGYRGKPRRVVWDRVCELYPLNDIADVVRTQLKTRAAVAAVRPTV